jgi:hypothetical protein
MHVPVSESGVEGTNEPREACPFDAQFLNRPMTTDRANKEPPDLEGFCKSG